MTESRNLSERTGRDPSRRLGRWILAAGLGGGLASQAAAGVILDVGSTAGGAVPDADPSGRAFTLVVPDTSWQITDVNVTLSFRGSPSAFGGWNGDLYAWLGHEGALAVLLNRVGRTASDPLSLGYADDGLSGVVLDDEAAEDVHFYQATLGFAPGVLTGRWQPDARTTDPGDPFNPDPLARAAYLDVFDTLDPQGEWVLYVADLEGGGELTLDSWRLEIAAEPIPEPETFSVVVASLLAGLAGWRMKRR